MIKKLDLYILKRLISRFLFLLISISSIILLTNFVEMIDNFINAQMTNNEIFNYYLLTLPMIISYATPMAITIASALLILSYIKNNELLAVRSLGINYFRFSSIIILFSIIISIGHFYFENNIVSISNHKKNKVIKKYNLKKNRSNSKLTNFIEDIDKNKSIMIMNFNNKQNIANNVTIKEKDSLNNIIYRFDSEKMIWNDVTKKWDFKKIEYRAWNNNKLITHKTINDTSFKLKNITPIYLITELTNPEEMNYFELKEFIKIKKNNAVNTNKWEVGLEHKISYVFSNIILAITAIVLSLAIKNTNTSYGIGLSLVIITLYYVAVIIGKNLGIEGILSPLISAWLGNIIFMFIILFCYKKYIF